MLNLRTLIEHLEIKTPNITLQLCRFSVHQANIKKIQNSNALLISLIYRKNKINLRLELWGIVTLKVTIENKCSQD